MKMQVIAKIITILLNSIMGIILIIFSGKYLAKGKNKLKLKQNIIPIIVYILFLSCNDYVGDRFLKTIISFIAIVILYKIIYKNDWFKTIISSLEIYLLILFSEIILCIIGYTFYIFNLKYLLSLLNNTIIINFIVILNSIIMIFAFRKIIFKINEIIEKHRSKFSIIYFLILLIMLSILLNKINLTKTFLNIEFYINLIFCIFLIIIIIIQIKQKIRYQNFLDKYKKLANFTQSIDSVMEEYRIKNHEYKNQLGIIKSLIKPNNKELHEYVDTLIEKSEITNSLIINQLNNLTLAGLKGLLNFKINELKQEKIHINILVDNNMKKVNFSNFNSNDKDDLYSIVGVFLDNAKEAAVETDKKQVFIDISIINKKIKLTIANSYKNNVNIEEIKKYGYSTKGNERGMGLYLIQKIIDKNEKFDIETKLKGEIFVQNLYIENYDK